MTLMMQNHTFQNTNNSEKTRNKTFDKNMFAWIYLPKWKRFNFGEHAKGAQKITYKCSDVRTCNLLVLFTSAGSVYCNFGVRTMQIEFWRRRVFFSGHTNLYFKSISRVRTIYSIQIVKATWGVPKMVVPNNHWFSY